MVNQIDSKLDFAHESTRNRRHETRSASVRTQQNSHYRFDDLIVTLSNAYENRRARQVTEWERMRHSNFPSAV